jgi:hypothetical protein
MSCANGWYLTNRGHGEGESNVNDVLRGACPHRSDGKFTSRLKTGKNMGSRLYTEDAQGVRAGNFQGDVLLRAGDLGYHRQEVFVTYSPRAQLNILVSQ